MSFLIWFPEILQSIFTIGNKAQENTGPVYRLGMDPFDYCARLYFFAFFISLQGWSLSFYDVSEYRYLFVDHFSHLQGGLCAGSFTVKAPHCYIVAPSFLLKFWKRLYVCGGLASSHTADNIHEAF